MNPESKLKTPPPRAGRPHATSERSPRGLLHHCRNPQILKTAVRTALVVGTTLAFINHFHGILNWNLSRTEITQILITYLVPFTVATYSAARHLQFLESLNAPAEPPANREHAAGSPPPARPAPGVPTLADQGSD